MPPQRGRFEFATYFFLVLALFATVSMVLNGQQQAMGTVEEASILAAFLQSSKTVTAPEPDIPHHETEQESVEESASLKQTAPRQDETTGGDASDRVDQLAGLSCARFGGPSDEDAAEMVYWRDIPHDNKHISPLKKSSREYLTFEADLGGWNNIRMGLETVIALAFAMGRTLVLPPEKEMYLINKQNDGQSTQFSFAHFFAMEAIHSEHPGLDIITMEEFLKREVMTGNIRDQQGRVVFPPGNETNFDGKEDTISKWLRVVARMATNWDPEECLAVFPATDKASDFDELLAINETIHRNLPTWEEYVGKPVPVDAPPIERFREGWAGRSRLCIYDADLQAAPVIHFATELRVARLLVHFYAFVAFQDWHQDLWLKRFVRDHVRYSDELQCAAARVVKAIRERVRDQNNPQGLFDTMHVRRGDFQYKGTRVDAQEILKMTKKVFAEGSTVFIATDERNKDFFNPLKQHYKVLFLDDFMETELAGVNTNFYGMIDQLIASRGRFFMGCWFSTFTGYINRLRGYHAQNDKTYPNYDTQGAIASWYYALADRFDHMQTYYPVKKSFFAREFPTAWRNIEYGMDVFHDRLKGSG